ncbi:MAG: hypothetical protein JO366_00410 [Methylobacteriaceae bacterium]|nr:hypothetical protein [Methylobacteriaceae bacterium]
MIGNHWAPRLVQAYLADAADTLRRLPGARGSRVFASPEIARGVQQLSISAQGQGPVGSPSPQAVDQAKIATSWLLWLDVDDQRIVWERAKGRSWKEIAHACKIDRTTAWRRLTCALAVIAAKLNAGEVQQCFNNAQHSN